MQKIHFFNFFQKFQYLFIKIQHLQMYHKYKSHVDYITIKDRLIYSRDLFVFIITNNNYYYKNKQSYCIISQVVW